MTFTDDEIHIVPGYCARTWQSCDYFARGVELFHCREGMRTPPPRAPRTLAGALWLAGGKDWVSCWFDVNGTRAEVEAIGRLWGGHAVEHPYAPEGVDACFLAFRDIDKALAFCRSDDFDRHALTPAKLG